MPDRDRSAFESKLFEQNQLFEKERQRERLLHEWLQMAVRLITLANAGGAVATLSFAGVTFSTRGVGNLELVALGIFVAGLVFPGTLMIAQSHRLWSDMHPGKSFPEPLGRLMDRIAARPGPTLIFGGTMFVVGALLGILALAGGGGPIAGAGP